MMKAAGRVEILGGVRIPFARQNTNYAAASNLDMLTATLKSIVERFGLEGRCRHQKCMSNIFRCVLGMKVTYVTHGENKTLTDATFRSIRPVDAYEQCRI
jgi:acetyl-CoA acetyltransferase